VKPAATARERSPSLSPNLSRSTPNEIHHRQVHVRQRCGLGVLDVPAALQLARASRDHNRKVQVIVHVGLPRPLPSMMTE
jgi:hypothetical protein